MKTRSTINVIAALIFCAWQYSGQAQEWIRQHPSYDLIQMIDIDMLPNGQGIATGADRTVLVTSNFGQDWEERNFMAANALTEVKMMLVNNQVVIWGLFANQLYKSEDFGETWQEFPPGINLGSGRFLYTPNASTIIAGGSTAFVKSVDGGTSWEIIHTNNSLTNSLSTVFSASAQNIWICGQGGNIEYLDFLSTGWSERIEVQEIGVYPNPTDGLLYLHLPKGLSPASWMQIYDVMGRLQWENPQSNVLELSFLSAGQYTLIVRDRRAVYQARIVKQ